MRSRSPALARISQGPPAAIGSSASMRLVLRPPMSSRRRGRFSSRKRHGETQESEGRRARGLGELMRGFAFRNRHGLGIGLGMFRACHWTRPCRSSPSGAVVLNLQLAVEALEHCAQEDRERMDSWLPLHRRRSTTPSAPSSSALAPNSVRRARRRSGSSAAATRSSKRLTAASVGDRPPASRRSSASVSARVTTLRARGPRP